MAPKDVVSSRIGRYTLATVFVGGGAEITPMSLLKRFFHREEPPLEDQRPLFAAVKDAMTDVQAYARSHGGEIRLLSVSDEGDVRIKLTGTCKGCPMSTITIKLGVEDQLKRLVPGVRKVIQQ